MTATPPAAATTRAPLPRFGLVLAAMFAEMLIVPFAPQFAGGLIWFRVLMVVILLGALVAAGARPLVLLLCAPPLVAQSVVLGRFNTAGAAHLEIACTVLHVLAIAYVFWFIVIRVVRAKVVSFDTVAGAACAYLLIAVIWGDLYFLHELLRPGSFQIPSAWIVGSSRDLREALGYFSFVMLTTVGHVFDVADVGTGFLCEAESLFGMLFLAGLIGRIVGLSISPPPPPPPT